MIKHHYKRHFNHLTSYLIYFALVVYFIVSGLRLNSAELSALTVNIGLVDLATNPISQQYYRDLRQYDILNVAKFDEAKALDLLADEVIDLVIVVPADYDPNEARHKPVYHYLATNALAPAALDLVAIDLVPHVVKHRLIQAAQRYQVGDEARALAGFDKYNTALSDNFDIAVAGVAQSIQLGEEQTLATLESAKKTLLFALFSIVLIAALPLNLRLHNSSALNARLAISRIGITRYYFAERLVSYGYLLLLWLVACLSVSWAIRLSLPLSANLALLGSVIISAYYELLCWLQRSAARSYINSFIALLVIILSAIVGGVFFDVDLLPPQIGHLVNAFPFNSLANAFYSGLSATSATGATAVVSYGAIATLLLFVNLGKIKRQVN